MITRFLSIVDVPSNQRRNSRVNCPGLAIGALEELKHSAGWVDRQMLVNM